MAMHNGVDDKGGQPRLVLLDGEGRRICSSSDAADGRINSLKPRGKASSPLALASKGTAQYVILLPASPSTQEDKAALDLARWLKEMTGAELPIVREGSGYEKPARAISIGNTEMLKEAGIPEAKLDLGDEGYAIGAKGRNLFLLGGQRRGPINAVYALLEEDLGCRWYDRTSSTIPYIPELRFSPVPRHFVPPFEIREPFYWDAWDRDWSLRNRTNSAIKALPVSDYSTPWPLWNTPTSDLPTCEGKKDYRIVSIPEEWGGQTDYVLFLHTFDTLMPPDEYFSAHPEYYAEVGGKRQASQWCLTNPDVLRIVTEKVMEMLTKNPHSEIISISQNDAGSTCTCANCSASDKTEGAMTGRLVSFLNKVAEVVGKEFPDVKISTLAYLGSRTPPKTVRPAKNLAFRLATENHAWAYPWLPVAESQEFKRDIAGWRDLGATVHIWDYAPNFSHYMVPMLNMQAVAQNLRFYVGHGVKGVLLQGGYQSPGTENAALRCWVWAKQLWDPSRETEALMRDFVYGYYGDAAEPVWEYNKMLYDIWESNRDVPGPENILWRFHIRYEPTDPLLSKDLVGRSLKLFEQAEEGAEDPEIVRRVRVAKLPMLYVALCQGLGWTGRDHPYDPGEWFSSREPATLAERKKLFDEFESTVKSEEITRFSEMADLSADAEPRLAEWRELLSRLSQ